MTKSISKALAIVGIVASLAGIAPSTAHAVNYFQGYICRFGYNPNGSSSVGSYGSAWASFYTAPGCGGTYVTTQYWFTTGATTYAVARYTEPGILALWQSFMQAMNGGARVYFWTYNGNDAPSEPFYEDQ
jgi:hypothetical protein